MQAHNCWGECFVKSVTAEQLMNHWWGIAGSSCLVAYGKCCREAESLGLGPDISLLADLSEVWLLTCKRRRRSSLMRCSWCSGALVHEWGWDRGDLLQPVFFHALCDCCQSCCWRNTLLDSPSAEKNPCSSLFFHVTWSLLKAAFATTVFNSYPD